VVFSTRSSVRIFSHTVLGFGWLGPILGALFYDDEALLGFADIRKVGRGLMMTYLAKERLGR
jgi:hypothetical protein